MLSLVPSQPQGVTEVAARLTDHALEFLRSFRPRGDSVEMELELWHALTAELNREMNERHDAAPVDEAPSCSALRKVVDRATLRVAAERSPFPEYRALCLTGRASQA